MFEFNVTNNEGEVDVDLKGRLDATVAPQLHEEMAKLQGSDIKKVTFNVKDLEYIASAGLRVIIFAKQKLGADTEIFMKDVNEDVKQVIEMTGCDNFVTIL
ncbi:MAG: STAS domain-containing protein [Lachnospiraceae bacterium]|nr:STAS domain-containing protein [Lachnospiraceae bacterium]